MKNIIYINFYVKLKTIKNYLIIIFLTLNFIKKNKKKKIKIKLIK